MTVTPQKNVDVLETVGENQAALGDFKRVRVEALDFRSVPASTGVYGIHPYPAMLHYLVVRELLNNYSQPGNSILDPFVGSGVVAGECLINNRNFHGFDINRLAILIALVRTSPLKSNQLVEALEKISNAFLKQKPQAVDFPNIHYWFDQEVIDKLSRLKQAISSSLRNKRLINFFTVVFSEAVRRVSKTRYNEFKLLRRKDHSNAPDPMNTFREIAIKNIGLLTTFYKEHPPTKISIKIKEKNILRGIPLDDNSIDLVLTSPPYGDSRTTVAYGQFSRLSLRWLGYEEHIDKMSLGGKSHEISPHLPSDLLYEYLEKISLVDHKRSKEVFAFYQDFFSAIEIISKKIKKNGHACFIVGNRRVKGIELPTDKITADFFEYFGFIHEKTLVRAISSKRMPAQNSPTNVKGKKDSTMKYEYIVVLKKKSS